MKPDRITRWLLIAIGVYSVLLVSFLNLVILNSDNVKDRAIFLMADGMILLWIIVGGSLTPMLRRRLVPELAAIPIDWRVRFVLFGITGSLAEATINPTSLIGGFWVFVYGLMVYLPACTVPRDRGARPLRWWHYPVAVFLPFLGVIPGGLVATVLRKVLGVQFLPGVE